MLGYFSLYLIVGDAMKRSVCEVVRRRAAWCPDLDIVRNVMTASELFIGGESADGIIFIGEQADKHKAAVYARKIFWFSEKDLEITDCILSLGENIGGH
jgi:hypothetical protein